jgi:tripartite-type tricarboxylate transporter receptor subunit TctC
MHFIPTGPRAARVVAHAIPKHAVLKNTALAAALLYAGMPLAHADFPDHAITIVVGYTAGGANDILARIMADKLSKELKQSVIVENKPGVASIVGATYVAKAKPDGYTLLMGASGPISFNPSLYKQLPYSPDKDLAPISLVATFPLILLTQNSNPATGTLPGLIDYANKNPKLANYGASAASFQLMTELFKKKTGTQFMYIPYKGSADSVTAVTTGDATIALVDAGPAMAGIQGGRVRPVAVTSAARVSYLPNVPTMKELGIDMQSELWSGLFAPAGTPAPIMAKLQKAVSEAVQSPEVQKRITDLSMTPKSSTSEDFHKQIEAEIALWIGVAKDAGIEPN